MNSHPQMDGMEFEENINEAGELVSIKCTIYRKDRKHPIAVTEYLTECVRATDPWKMKHRMLRHKAAIQCARYAFGFAGIYDEDEGAIIAQARDVSPLPPTPPAPPPPPARQIEAQATFAADEPEVPPATNSAAPEDDWIDPEKLLKDWEDAAAAARDGITLLEAWNEIVEPAKGKLFPPDLKTCEALYEKRLKVIGP